MLHQQTVSTEPRTPLSPTLFLCIFLFLSIPFGKAVPADDDLFPPIRPPPADVTALQADDAEEWEEDAAGDADADADADVGMGDGSDASEESDEVSSSV